MDERRNCIVKFDRNINDFIDIASDVEKIEENTILGKYTVTFRSGKSYEYNKSSITWLTDPQEIDITDKIVYSFMGRLNHVKEILHFGSWIKVVYENNKISSYPVEKIKIVRNRVHDIEVKNILEYLKETAGIVNKASGEDAGFIENELKNMEISEESILSKVLANAPLCMTNDREGLIFPFVANTAQMQAVKNALQSDVSVIQGPPGTGKTETILNIIANLLMRDKKIAIVSSNNEATKNVLEKLGKVNLASIGAFLGRESNIEEFFKQQHCMPEFDIEESFSMREQELEKLCNNAMQIYEHKMRYAEINKEIREYAVEKEKNDEAYKQNSHEIPVQITEWQQPSEEYLALAAFLETLLCKHKIGFFDKFKLRFCYKVRKAKDVIKHLSDCIAYLQNRFYKVKLEELSDEKDQKEEFLKNETNTKILNDFQWISMERLKRHLSEYFAKLRETDFSLRDYRYRFVEFNKRYPIIYSTTHALHLCSGNYLYDYVIVDESSQVDLASAFIAMSCAKRIVFVGDLKQLPQIIKNSDKRALQDLFEKYAIPDQFDYAQNSILRCIIKQYGAALPNVFLNEHYRCDPQIIEFCNKRFYNGKLHIQTVHEDGCGLKIIATRSHSALGRKNESQVAVAQQEILPKTGYAHVGIIAPYRAQVQLFKAKLNGADYVDTVHKFQGKQEKTIILSTVSDKAIFYEDDEKSDFLNNENLINVALSRAENNLYVIASKDLIRQKGTLINELARYAAYYCGNEAVEESKVYSIFDLMYDAYLPILHSLKEKMLHISEYDSENIVATLLREICSSGKFGNIDFKFNYPLGMLIESRLLNDVEDRQFAENRKTHCDFVVYDRIDKTPRLVIEVDGKQHEQKVQQVRDMRKDRILHWANIPVLRLKTTDIDCEEKIKKALVV